ncbi:MAG: HupE/UreJ family protein [Candidatus Nanosalina sp.]
MRKRFFPGLFLAVLISSLSAPAASHAFTIPEWNQSDVEQYTPARDFLQNTEEVDRGPVATFSLGVEHILEPDSSFFNIPTPFLNDHGLLLIGLILVPGLLSSFERKNILRLFELASAFAVGHGLALLSVYFNLIDIPGFLVESGIAFSIAIVGLERYAMIEGLRKFKFREDILLLLLTGFWHGNGFVAVVENVQFSGIREALSYLAIFTLGVDTGQFIFLAAAGTLIYLFNLHFERNKFLKSLTLVLVVAGTGLGLFRLFPVIGGVI